MGFSKQTKSTFQRLPGSEQQTVDCYKLNLDQSLTSPMVKQEVGVGLQSWAFSMKDSLVGREKADGR